MNEKAKKTGLKELIETKQGDICSISFPDDYFDFVLAEGDPISYCKDPARAVAELHRVLKPRCYVSAGVDSLYSILRRTLARNRDVDTAWFC